MKQYVRRAVLMCLCVALIVVGMPVFTLADTPEEDISTKMVLGFEGFPTNLWLGSTDDTQHYMRNDKASQISSGANSARVVEGSPLTGKWLEYTVKTAAGNGQNLSMNLPADSVSGDDDWTGYDGLQVYVDTSALTGAVNVALYFTEADATNTMDHWVLGGTTASGAVAYQDAQGNWVNASIVDSRYASLPVGYKGWVRMPFTMFGTTWSANANGRKDLKDILFLQFAAKYVSADDYGKSVFFDNAMVYRKKIVAQDVLIYSLDGTAPQFSTNVGRPNATNEVSTSLSYSLVDTSSMTVGAGIDGTALQLKVTNQSFSAGHHSGWLRMNYSSSITSWNTDWSNATALKFYVDATAAEEAIRIMPVLMTGSGSYWGEPIQGMTATLTTDVGTAGTVTADEDAAFVLPAGFAGWVSVPLTANNWTNPWGQQIVSLHDGLSGVTSICLSVSGAATGDSPSAGVLNKPILVDSFTIHIEPPAETNDVAFSAAFGDGMVLQQNKEIGLFGTATPEEEVTVTLIKDAGTQTVGTKTVTADATGAWSVVLDTPQAGGFDTYTLRAEGTLGTSDEVTGVLFGEVWLAGGQSNMQLTVGETIEAGTWEAKERNPYIRIYLQSAGPKVGRERTDATGVWVSASSWAYVRACSAVAYYFAEKVYGELNVPIGIINSAKGGTSIVAWISGGAMDENTDFKQLVTGKGYSFTAKGDNLSTVSAFYNSRIAPFKGFRVGGILWYQGEADRYNPEVLEAGLPVLWDCWNDVFNGGEKLPIFTVQLAAYDDLERISKANAAMVRGMESITEAGGIAAAIPLYDVAVDVTDIHPVTKQPVGERIATAALGMVYSDPAQWGTGPVLKSYEIASDGSAATLTFETDSVGTGLKLLTGETLNGFTVTTTAGRQAVTATITGTNTVKLSLTGIDAGKGIDYAYGQAMMTANLSNGIDFPALPFSIETSWTASASTGVKGDVTGDGNVNIADVRMALRASIGKITLTDDQKAAADVNGDGNVNVLDVRKLLRYAVKKINSLDA